MMKLWVVVCFLFMGKICAYGAEKNHNGVEHDLLCKVLKAVVYKLVKEESTLSEPLKKALKQTIFGYGGGGTLEELKKSLPGDYKKEGADRGQFCGQQHETSGYYDAQPRWAGHSAPHDMVCLCTTGEKGWPLNESVVGMENDRLCGQLKDALGGGKDGWGSQKSSWDKTSRNVVTLHDKGENQLEATWQNVTGKCLDGKQEDLRDALKNFINKLVNRPQDTSNPNRYRLGEGDFSEPVCNGNKKVCVMYYPNSTETKTWWVDLETALIEDAEIQKQREEEERRRQQEDSQSKNSAQAAALTSGHPTTNQTERQQNDNITDTIRKLNLTRSSSIILPSSWLLNVVFLF
ncbi:Variant surface glycoprotein [Trypanosoma congolense IL3000]|uniref:Variant surface glycoprotein n=1 Tax=Trypanosoma congolense (strain IL3000) TaxID=1068625 RepID=F9W7R0_TRYCI|nr:Variant surface glycoprotein [Trypanosoma congolense IL3000]